MRSDSIELEFIRGARRARRAARHDTRPLTRAIAIHRPSADAMDEAMAHFHVAEVGRPQAVEQVAETRSSRQSRREPLWADLSAQLEALDRQRRHLIELLRDIDA